MKLSRQYILSEAEDTGFRPEILEKVFHLLNLLDKLKKHPFLKGRLALKGGTALNVFLFELPRLSVDIDLNYIGAVDRDVMLAERPKLEKGIEAVCEREEMSVNRSPDSHAGGKWRLSYESAITQGGNLEVDVNYMFRQPLWPIVERDSRRIGAFQATAIPTLDIHELAAGKLVALLSRQASRDLFDVHQLLTKGRLDTKKLRLGFVLYGAMNRKDWRTVSINDVMAASNDVRAQLLPLLQTELIDKLTDPEVWAMDIAEDCCQLLESILPLADDECDFLNRLLDDGEIVPSLLTSDAHMTERINNHPLLQWKALNVREYKGSAEDSG